MTVKVQCTVCYDSFALDTFRFLPTCGHGLCIACSAKTHKKPDCVTCRRPKGGQEPIRIYITLAESSGGAAHSVVDKLKKIGPESVALSVQKAGKKIRHAMKDLEADVAHDLLAAAKDLDERIYPLFQELELARDQIATQNAHIQELQQVVESGEDEIKQLRRSLKNAKVHESAAVFLAEKAEKAKDAFQAENVKLNRTVQRQLSDLAAKENEDALLRAKLTRRDDKLTRRENRISVLEKKLKLLSRSAKHPKPEENDPDESLQIDKTADVRDYFSPIIPLSNAPTVQGIRNPRKSNDWIEPHVARRGGNPFKRVRPSSEVIEL
ncbi:hypothetical protein GGX14DRAFT_670359 [Mycena pura]|uniref:RING-type domain-containing protein n=1 Tax=Mycena pura TaxID=153505 RepID=A0AAD6VSQ0_9AGAR|nr:hypothetical protein GGX14DRAFT_670359 [Mycena pura]